MVYPAILPLMRTPRLPVVDWTDAPADLNWLIRFAERRNLVSARLPSHFNWPLSSVLEPTDKASRTEDSLLCKVLGILRQLFMNFFRVYLVWCLYATRMLIRRYVKTLTLQELQIPPRVHTNLVINKCAPNSSHSSERISPLSHNISTSDTGLFGFIHII